MTEIREVKLELDVPVMEKVRKRSVTIGGNAAVWLHPHKLSGDGR